MEVPLCANADVAAIEKDEQRASEPGKSHSSGWLRELRGPAALQYMIMPGGALQHCRAACTSWQGGPASLEAWLLAPIYRHMSILSAPLVGVQLRARPRRLHPRQCQRAPPPPAQERVSEAFAVRTEHYMLGPDGLERHEEAARAVCTLHLPAHLELLVLWRTAKPPTRNSLSPSRPSNSVHLWPRSKLRIGRGYTRT